MFELAFQRWAKSRLMQCQFRFGAAGIAAAAGGGWRCVAHASWIVDLCLHPCSWEDGELVHKRLLAPSRWDVHSAEEVAVTLGGDVRIRILQQV